MHQYIIMTCCVLNEKLKNLFGYRIPPVIWTILVIINFSVFISFLVNHEYEKASLSYLVLCGFFIVCFPLVVIFNCLTIKIKISSTNERIPLPLLSELSQIDMMTYSGLKMEGEDLLSATVSSYPGKNKYIKNMLYFINFIGFVENYIDYDRIQNLLSNNTLNNPLIMGDVESNP